MPVLVLFQHDGCKVNEKLRVDGNISIRSLTARALRCSASICRDFEILHFV